MGEITTQHSMQLLATRVTVIAIVTCALYITSTVRGKYLEG